MAKEVTRAATTATRLALVGRREELELLGQLRSADPAASAIVSGPAGVGKSRLAQVALTEAAAEGWATLAARGSSGFAAVPFGPLRTVLEVTSSADLVHLTTSVADALLALRSRKGLLMLVDDCQDLDESSAGLLHQLVASGSIVLLATARAGAGLPVALADLWKDGLAERIELQNLSVRESVELLVASLGGHVQDSSANRIWQVTEGNPLYLREVVLSCQETGALREVDGEWRLRRDWVKGARLKEVVAARLGRLDPDESTAMEMLALTGSLPLDLLTRLTTAGALEDLERRALVTSERNGRRVEVAIAHPLHAEVLRDTMPALRQRAIRRNLVQALTAASTRRAEDLVRLACWSIESGLEVDPVTLSLGSDAALHTISRSISERLSEILPEHAPPVPAGPAAVRQDHQLAVRLARAAYERRGGVVDALALVSAHAWVGDTASAESVLAEVAPKAVDVDDRLRLEITLGWIRFWCHHDADRATAGLLEAASSARGCDPVLLAQVYEGLAGIALNTARPTQALEYAHRAASAAGVELSKSIAAAPAAAALTYLGRTSEAIDLADRALPTAESNGHPLAMAALLFARAAGLLRRGELEPARELMSWLRDLALSRDLLDAVAIFGVLLGEILLRQGRPASAGRIFRDSSGLLAERDILGYRPWALSGLARARARLGQSEESAAALVEAELVHPIARHFDISLYLAHVELERSRARPAEAARAAAGGVAWAAEAGLVGDEAIALEESLRLSPSRELAARLGELSAETDSQYVATLADYARALCSRDVDGLLEAGDRVAAMTAWWSAADATAAAVPLLDGASQKRAAKAAALKATTFASKCEGYVPSTPGMVLGPVRLTKREAEIARFAVAGGANREIAERMYLSLRTVENHLHHVYVRLGVTDRAGLAAVSRLTAPVEQLRPRTS